MKVSEFDYTLPPELIAQHPCQRRDHSRLLVLDKKNGAISHRHFYDLPSLLGSNDLLVLNDTKVLPARLFARKPTGGQLEVLLINPVDDRTWSCLVKPAKRATAATQLQFAGGLRGEVVGLGDEGLRTIRFSIGGQEFQDKLAQIGEMPLPPYIHEKPADPGRYQTVYAAAPGAVAAPTAGLHFTPELFRQLEEKGVETAFLTLHVGIGTFRPVSAENVEEHHMHREYYAISPETARIINEAKARGNRIVAVGTTSVRVLETAAWEGVITPGSGWTDIFIYPGYRFSMVDALITNFHLPHSTLLMLVSALAGRERILAAYQEAVAREYRFFSFGDAMLIL
ncbi:MAG TPA: tRNA preQ1(34) S-adenosylmethionine ribosyltransferase-isomerase QueA [Firmicutes bacterium]|jgi:S-adenosylmethionine:tRNA ribosyltransferase-isomerase|nr:tRNA preQ1(34) S-adenosylmethionine ribosyltransferase-isomerase QueA [Bacillota bacterium]